MKADNDRKEAYLRSEVNQLINETTFLGANNARETALFRSEIGRLKNDTTTLKTQLTSKSKCLKHVVSNMCIVVFLA